MPGVRDDGEAELWRPPFALVSSPHRITHTHTHTHTFLLYTHALTRTHPPHCVYPLSTHAQTFAQVPPGFDGWSVSALPPVSYTYNLIWGATWWEPHQSRANRSSQAVLSLHFPSQVKSSRIHYIPLLRNICMNTSPLINKQTDKEKAKLFGCIIYPSQFLMCLRDLAAG